MPMRLAPTDAPRALTREWLALGGASLLLGLVLGIVVSCGNDDLVFPGNVPNTPTGVNTSTPTPA
ncbi:MAG: hypothetical protein AB7V27_04110 [Candidatus Binatia bacterium]